MTDYLRIIIQIILITILFVISLLLIRLKNMLKKEKRLTKFTTPAVTTKQISFFDKLENIYFKLIKQISNFNKKIKIFNSYSKKYEIYIDQTKRIREDAMDFISNKFLVAFITLIIIVISNVLRVQKISIIQIILALLIGFFLPDIFLYINNKIKRKQIENELLKAVTIMNNAFKSGRSIMQAVNLVSTELDGPISDEFKKMYIDLNFGLDLEIVFKRLADRVKLDEISYMTSSLVILNKTGGNIVKVFGTIEKGFFDRKKLSEELKSSIALSELVFKVLITLPLFIVIVVYLFDSNYFDPLINTTIGRVIIIIILVIYITYILIVRKITKLKE